MVCKACNTRIDSGMRACPNCGRSVKGAGLAGRANEARPALSPSTARAEARRAPEPAELELDESHELKTAGDEIEEGIFGLELDAGRLLSLLSAEPELLGAGVVLHKEGKKSGAGFATDVGEIDLLARDEDDGWLVVMVAEGEPGRELMSDMLERIGWVRKHLGKDGEDVRGLVLTQGVSDELRYAVAALGDTLRFKTWRLSLALEDVDLED